MKSLLVFVVSMLVASTAFAKICKTVGPDGSVTYTDRPAESCADSSAKQEVARVDGKASKSGAIATAMVAPAVATEVTEVASAASIERSIVGILALEDRVRRAYDFCAALQPAAIRRYGDATDGWRERNATATREMNRALTQGFDGAQQRVIRDGVSKRNEQQMTSMRAMLASAQLKWCDQTASEIESRSLDVAADLSAPLAGL